MVEAWKMEALGSAKLEGLGGKDGKCRQRAQGARLTPGKARKLTKGAD